MCQRKMDSTKREDFTVLVVDNDRPTLAMVATKLRSWAYKVVTVDNGCDAMATLREYRKYIDLVITDLHMPGLDGLELQQLIKKEFHKPVIIMSEDKRKSIIAKCLGNGATFFLEKPVSADDVKDVWQYAVAGRDGKEIQVLNSAVSSPTGSKKTTEDAGSSARSSSGSLSPVRELKQKKENNKRKRSEKIKTDQSHEQRPPAPKKTKVNWTAYLENLFLMAVTQIGLDKAVPKKILEIMDVPELTRENVASHLQKYRIFLNRVSSLGSLEGISERTLKSKFAATLPPEVIDEIQQRLSQSKRSNRGIFSGTLYPSNTTIPLQDSNQASMPQVASTQLPSSSYRTLSLGNRQAPQARYMNQVTLGGQSLIGSNRTSNYQQPLMSGYPSAPFSQPNYLYSDMGSRFSAYGSVNAANNGLMMGGNYGVTYSSPAYNYGSLARTSLGNQNGIFNYGASLGNQNGSLNYATSVGNQLGSLGNSSLPLSSAYCPSSSGAQLNGGEPINTADVISPAFAVNATHQLVGLGSAGRMPQSTIDSAWQAQPDQLADDLSELLSNIDNFLNEAQVGEEDLGPNIFDFSNQIVENPQGNTIASTSESNRLQENELPIPSTGDLNQAQVGEEVLRPSFFDFSNQIVENPQGNTIASTSESNRLQSNELPIPSTGDLNQLQGSHGHEDSDPFSMFLVEDIAAPTANKTAATNYKELDWDVDLIEALFGADKPNYLRRL